MCLGEELDAVLEKTLKRISATLDCESSAQRVQAFTLLIWVKKKKKNGTLNMFIRIFLSGFIHSFPLYHSAVEISDLIGQKVSMGSNQDFWLQGKSEVLLMYLLEQVVV